MVEWFKRYTGRRTSEYRRYFEGPYFSKKHEKYSVITSFVKFQAALGLPGWIELMGTFISNFLWALKMPTKIHMYLSEYQLRKCYFIAT